jgi:hypothetical protein
MAGELVKYRPSDLSRKIDTALERIRAKQIVARISAVDVVELPRICCMRKKPYTARYIVDGEKLLYSRSIRIYRGLDEVKYVEGLGVTVTAQQIGSERCAWCAAVGWGALRCGRCKSLVCYGKSTDDWMRCYCGYEGRVIEENFDEQGIIPQGF